MKVFLTADIEGVTGATHWDETDKKHADYAEFREQMTAEVVAACEGALAAGATEIWVKDAHASARNILADKLPREARLLRGWSGHPFGMVNGLDGTFAALLFVGYHSRAGSGASPLSHTISGQPFYIRINERYAAEFLMYGYVAGLVGVPAVFLSGDAGLCEDARSLIPAIETVAVKEGVGDSTVNIHPHLAVERIRAGAERALKGDLSRCRVPMPAHFAVEIAYKSHFTAYGNSFYPGARLAAANTIQFESDDYFEVMRFFSFVL